jgi:antitoxin (DNA-binding transcriptional repressor) of toxin-antitoxin stability system
MARPPLSVRDLRLHWPAAERRLKREGELVVTRDGEPVAKLIAYRPEKLARPKSSAQRHLAWLNRAWKGDDKGPSTDELLKQDRDE